MSVVRDDAAEKFNKIMPCADCSFIGICKKAYGIKPFEVPEDFEINIKCKTQSDLISKIRSNT